MRPRCVTALLAVLLAGGFQPLAAGADGQQPAQASTQTQPPAPQADAARSTRFQGGIGLLAGVPVGDFGVNVDSAGGIAGHFDVALGDSIVSVGGEMASLWYGTESRKEPLSPTIPDIRVTVTTDNTIFLLHGRVRAQRREGRVRPYVDGLIGFIDLVTKTSIEELGDCDVYGCTGLGSTNLRDFALSAGGGAGLQVGFGPPPDWYRLDLSVRYLYGGEADYLREFAIRREGGQAFLDISRSRTDMVVVYIGVAMGR